MKEKAACNLIEKFEFDIRDLSYGWETICLKFDKVSIVFRTSYVGEEPLSTLISSAADLQNEGDNVCNLFWHSEPGHIELEIKRKEEIIDIVVKEEGKRQCFTMPFLLFSKAVVDAGLKALRKYGIRGFNDNWDRTMSFDYFPINSLLKLLGCDSVSDDALEEVRSNVFNELDLLIRRLKDV